jgi:hypothetical protein
LKLYFEIDTYLSEVYYSLKTHNIKMKTIFYAVIATAIFTACAKDKEIPSIEINSPNDGARVALNTNVQLDFICKDNKELHDVKYEVTALSNNTILASGEKDVDKKEYTQSISFVTPSAPGSIKIKIDADDHAGNKIEKTITIIAQQ